MNYLLDTHIWIWYCSQQTKISGKILSRITKANTLYVSIISCWEVAKLVEKKRIAFTVSVDYWIKTALKYPKIKLINLTPDILIQSTQLPGTFHNDPADQIIVATARTHNLSLLTADERILNYEFIKT